MSETFRAARIYGLLFLVAFVLSVWMLLTDKNLRTNFGLQTSGIYLHWYVIVVLAFADVAGAVLLFTLGSRRAVVAGIAGSGVAVLIFLGDIFSYSQVGGGFFSSPSEFAKYLFGISYYGGDVRYLYDTLLAAYLITFLVGWAILRRGSRRRSSPPAAWNSHPAASEPEGGAPHD